jgi:hypothetical protein
LKYLYKFETLVPFEVLALRLDAAIPAPLPMLETLSKIFNGNAVKGRQRFSVNLCNVRKFPALQILLYPREQKKLQGACSGEWAQPHFVFSQKGGILLTLQRFNKNRWRPSTAFLLKPLDNVPSNGSGTQIAASSRRGSSLKRTSVSNLYNHFK